MKTLIGAAYIEPTYIALVYVLLNDKDEGLEWLERAYEAYRSLPNGISSRRSRVGPVEIGPAIR